MTIHIGRLTSEVTATGGDRTPRPADGADSGDADGAEPTEWEQRRRLTAAVNRHHHDRMRTATGYGDD